MRRRFDPFWPVLLVCTTMLACAALGEAKGPTCQAIDLAHQACILVTYTDAEGRVVQQPVSAEDLAGVARMKRAAAAASASASVSSSSSPAPVTSVPGLFR